MFVKNILDFDQDVSQDIMYSICDDGFGDSMVLDESRVGNVSSELSDSSMSEDTYKHTHSTQDTLFTHDQTDVYASQTHTKHNREIFLVSKMKKRPPKRSFDMSDLRTFTQDINMSEPISQDSSLINSLDKEKIGQIYNQSVDTGCLDDSSYTSLSNLEKDILNEMFILRFESCKIFKRKDGIRLIDDVQTLRSLLSKSSESKKRTEELLKKNFKTVLKMMIEVEETSGEKFKGANFSEKQEQFCRHYFKDRWHEHIKIFKCMQMNREFYSNIFKNDHFKQSFRSMLGSFIEYFKEDRVSKTINLIVSISQDLMMTSKCKSTLRTPWSVKEAEASLNQMMKVTC